MDTDHNDIIATDRTYFTEAEAHQFEVGRINLHTMAFNSGGRLCFAAKITVNSVKHGTPDVGWGKIIFEGSLEELIAKLAPLPEVHETPLEAAPELIVKG